MTGSVRAALILLSRLAASSALGVSGIALWAAPAHAGAASASVKSMNVQLVDASALLAPAPPLPLLTTTPKPTAISAGLLPAPLPNPDAEPPHGDAARGPSLDPAFFSRPLEFQGNGFARASNSDYGVDQKTKPAAGLNLSVPVKQ
jgi:hypothetical protein